MKKLIIISILLFGVEVAIAQPSGGGGNVNPTPFGFTEVLLLGGALIGLKKSVDNSKKMS